MTEARTSIAKLWSKLLPDIGSDTSLRNDFASSKRWAGGGECVQMYVPQACSQSTEQQNALQATRRMYSFMVALKPDDLEFGSRSYHLGKILDAETTVDPDAALEASAAILRCSKNRVPDAAKAALLRAIAGKPGLESRSEFTVMCISSLWSGDEMQAVAAARTLGEMADSAAAPQIRNALKHIKGERVKKVIKEALTEIERQNGINSSATAGA